VPVTTGPIATVGEHSKAVPSKFCGVPSNFVVPRKFVIKHVIKNKSLVPLKMYLSLPNLKNWLRKLCNLQPSVLFVFFGKENVFLLKLQRRRRLS